MTTSQWTKRLIDIALAGAALVLLAPALAAVALAVYVAMGRPVLFRQVRAGQKGRPFTLLKFRTMRDLRGPDGTLLPDAQRLSAAGRWLRRWSLDELPQLWNVLRGQMSLVGPRPLLVEYISRYSPEQARRLEAKPGLTGWAQVRGRNAISWEERFRLDVWYVVHRSVWLDFYILLLTAWKVACGEGISAGTHATMPEFTGSTLPGRKAA